MTSNCAFRGLWTAIPTARGQAFRSARTYRPDPGPHPHKRAHHTAATAKTARPSAKERNCKSLNRLTTENAKLGNFSVPVLGKFEMPLTNRQADNPTAFSRRLHLVVSSFRWLGWHHHQNGQPHSRKGITAPNPAC